MERALHSEAQPMKSVRAVFSRGVATLLRPFSKVEPAEVAVVTVMTLAAFLLLTAYYLLKTVREPMILLQGGAEVKLYARAGQAVIMVVFVHFYGELARKVGRTKLLLIVFSFFVSNLVVFALLARTDLSIGLPFFLWVGVFSYTVVAQFWGLAADLCSEEQGKRLFPIIGGGSSIGAVVGARIAKSLVPFGASVLMLTAVGILVVCVALIFWAGRRPLRADAGAAPKREEPLSAQGAFELLAHDRYLLLIAGLVILLNWVNSSGEYLLDRTLLVAAREASAHGVASDAYIGAFKADYFAWYNAIGLVLQLFAVSRILRVVGVQNALFFLPAFAVVAYTSAALLPVLAVMRLVKIGENSLQYSLQETTRHALFLRASRVEKFVGKTAVDTVFVRLGAIASAVTVWIGTRAGWTLQVFAIIDAVLALIWMAVVVSIAREHRRRGEEGDSPVAASPAPS
jgi:AAA family ATP:ADP antiporter